MIHEIHNRILAGFFPDSSICGVVDFSKFSDDYGSALRFTGAMVGLRAQDLGGGWVVADFDYFDYQSAAQ